MEDPVMRVMVIVKANKESEAGVLPSRELLTEMGKFNEELVKAGGMLEREGRAGQVRRGQEHRDGWPVHRDQGADRGLLAVAGEVHRGGHRVDPALPVPEGQRGDRDPPGVRGRGLRREPDAGTAGAGSAAARARWRQTLTPTRHSQRTRLFTLTGAKTMQTSTHLHFNGNCR